MLFSPDKVDIVWLVSKHIQQTGGLKVLCRKNMLSVRGMTKSYRSWNTIETAAVSLSGQAGVVERCLEARLNEAGSLDI